MRWGSVVREGRTPRRRIGARQRLLQLRFGQRPLSTTRFRNCSSEIAARAGRTVCSAAGSRSAAAVYVSSAGGGRRRGSAVVRRSGHIWLSGAPNAVMAHDRAIIAGKKHAPRRRSTRRPPKSSPLCGPPRTRAISGVESRNGDLSGGLLYLNFGNGSLASFIQLFVGRINVMRMNQRAAFVLVLMWFGVMSGQAAAAKQPREAGGQQLAQAPAAAETKQKKTRKTRASSQTLKIPLDEAGPAYAGVIDEIDDDGVLTAIPVSLPGQAGLGASLTEGLYLAVVTSASPDEGIVSKGAHILLAEVKRIEDAGKLEMRVSADAFKQLEADQFIYLLRPRGSTTDQMKAIPPIAALESSDGDVLPGIDAASLVQSENNLKQIGLAMHNFHDVYLRFPPAVIYGPDGKPWHSWRVLILPFIEQLAIYDQYRWNEPWDGPNNSKLLKSLPSVYRDPVNGESDDTYTHYAAVTGKDTAFGSEGPRLSEATENGTQAIGKAIGTGGIKIAQIIDGTSNTLMVGPVSPERKIPWMKPEDIVVEDDFPGIGKEGGFAAPYKRANGKAGIFLFCDGSVTRILDSIRPESLRKLLLINDNLVIEEKEIPTLGPGRNTPRPRPEIHIVRDGTKVSARLVLFPRDQPDDYGSSAPTERAPAKPAPIDENDAPKQ